MPCGFLEGLQFPLYTNYWTTPTSGSSDLWSTLTDSSCTLSPKKSNQMPKSGTNFAGIYVSDPDPVFGENYREYLQIELNQSLIPGRSYYAEIYIMLSKKLSQYASNNIGMHFSDTAVGRTDYHTTLGLVPQINESQVITDTANWHKVTGCFVARSSLRYLIIGNFFDNSQTEAQAVKTANGDFYAYYFIDDVYVGETEALPENVLGNDVVLCQGETVILDASVAGATYQWDDYTTEPTLIASTPGTYWVDITVGNCTVRDSIKLTREPDINLGKDTLLCYGETLTLNATHPNSQYLWSDNTTEATLTVSEPGTYSVQIPSTHCIIGETIQVSFIDCPGEIPNVFTPGNDDKNETFYVQHVENRDWKLQVFNRWGKPVYQCDNYRNNWDGSGLSAGVYVYHLSNEALQRSYKGWVQLLREEIRQP